MLYATNLWKSWLQITRFCPIQASQFGQKCVASLQPSITHGTQAHGQQPKRQVIPAINHVPFPVSYTTLVTPWWLQWGHTNIWGEFPTTREVTRVVTTTAGCALCADVLEDEYGSSSGSPGPPAGKELERSGAALGRGVMAIVPDIVFLD